MDITAVFGTAVVGSIPAESTILVTTDGAILVSDG